MTRSSGGLYAGLIVLLVLVVISLVITYYASNIDTPPNVTKSSPPVAPQIPKSPATSPPKKTDPLLPSDEIKVSLSKTSGIDFKKNFTWQYDDGTVSDSKMLPAFKGCSNPNKDKNGDWIMKPAYVSGRGTKDRHWIYASSEEDKLRCMRNWTYYTPDGNNTLVEVTTDIGEKGGRQWCALPVYKKDGKQDVEWEYCTKQQGFVPHRESMTENNDPDYLANFEWVYEDTNGVQRLRGCGAPDKDPQGEWIMKAAYVQGRGAVIDLEKNPEKEIDCLRNWTYYDENGNVIANSVPIYSSQGPNGKKWCPEAKYTPGGKRGIEWEYCQLILDVTLSDGAPKVSKSTPPVAPPAIKPTTSSVASVTLAAASTASATGPGATSSPAPVADQTGIKIQDELTNISNKVKATVPVFDGINAKLKTLNSDPTLDVVLLSKEINSLPTTIKAGYDSIKKSADTIKALVGNSTDPNYLSSLDAANENVKYIEDSMSFIAGQKTRVDNLVSANDKLKLVERTVADYKLIVERLPSIIKDIKSKDAKDTREAVKGIVKGINALESEIINANKLVNEINALLDPTTANDPKFPLVKSVVARDVLVGAVTIMNNAKIEIENNAFEKEQKIANDVSAIATKASELRSIINTNSDKIASAGAKDATDLADALSNTTDQLAKLVGSLKDSPTVSDDADTNVKDTIKQATALTLSAYAEAVGLTTKAAFSAKTKRDRASLTLSLSQKDLQSMKDSVTNGESIAVRMKSAKDKQEANNLLEQAKGLSSDIRASASNIGSRSAELNLSGLQKLIDDHDEVVSSSKLIVQWKIPGFMTKVQSEYDKKINDIEYRSNFKWRYLVTDADRKKDKVSGPFKGCANPDNSPNSWIIKPAYVAGRGRSPVYDKSGKLITEGTWKYTEDKNDPDCMRNWTYYDENYNVVQRNIESITKLKDTKNWCPMAFYISGGKEGTEWEKC